MLQRQFRAEASARKIAPIRAGTLPCPIYTGTNLPGAPLCARRLRDCEMRVLRAGWTAMRACACLNVRVCERACAWRGPVGVWGSAPRI